MRMQIYLLALLVCIGSGAQAGTAVVTDGKFTNIYVYPNPDRETWEQHLSRLRPSDAALFSRRAIDRFTDQLMTPGWPSYFDSLYQYSGIRPPRFLGSAVISQRCVDAAMRDLHNGVMQWDTIRSLSNCHIDGRDPSPQVNLIFSPDIKIGAIVPFGTSGDMCTTTTTRGWHAWGINTPNFAAIPTDPRCTRDFAQLTKIMSHEIVEILSDPAGAGMGDFGFSELGDNCQSRSDGLTTWGEFTVERYWSEADKSCQPRLDSPGGSNSATWMLGSGRPLRRFTGSDRSFTFNVPAGRVATNATVTQVLLVLQTGEDNLRGRKDNASATLNFAGGSASTSNINAGRSWERGTTHAVRLNLPSPAPRVSDLTSVTLKTNFTGGFDGDNWDLDKAALIVSFAAASVVSGPTPPVTRTWLDMSGAPLVRFTGDRHDRTFTVARQDVARRVRSLELVISTGNDDLRGGKDNCDVTILLSSGRNIQLRNVNQGRNWAGGSVHSVTVPLPTGGLSGGSVTGVSLHTQFGGGMGGDNWNVQRVQLKATLQ